ncbi:MAG TPA: hypothetical protein VGG30_12765 [Pirellulales bacterium]|jgi:hypothetical protein
MEDDREKQDFTLGIQRLPISAEHEEFLIGVRGQFEAEMAAARLQGKTDPDTPAADQ